jgi:hypothetical protein
LDQALAEALDRLPRHSAPWALRRRLAAQWSDVPVARPRPRRWVLGVVSPLGVAIVFYSVSRPTGTANGCPRHGPHSLPRRSTIAEGVPSEAIARKICHGLGDTPENFNSFLEHLRFNLECLEADYTAQQDERDHDGANRYFEEADGLRLCTLREC